MVLPLFLINYTFVKNLMFKRRRTITAMVKKLHSWKYLTATSCISLSNSKTE